MKVRPTGGNQPVFKLGPTGKIDKKSGSVGLQALKNARIKSKTFSATSEAPSAKVVARVRNAAFGVFRKKNTPNE
jgi:hypothetical protein